MAGNKPIPKTQEQLSQESLDQYINPETGTPVNSKGPLDTSRDRANQRSLKGDNVQPFKVGLEDIDEAIMYYFNNVIRPSVILNDKRISVPTVYGTPERWNSMQRDGFFRDKNGKMQAPLIVFKRDSVTKNRHLGNKMGANRPRNFEVFEKRFSRKNMYDQFSVLTNRVPVKEYYAVAVPDYVDLVYSCVIFTDFVEHTNKIVEAINFASDSYWGDPEKFRFRAMIDSYTTPIQLNQGEERTNKTEFQIKLLGYVIPDTINAQPYNNSKIYSETSIKFGMETVNKFNQ